MKRNISISVVIKSNQSFIFNVIEKINNHFIALFSKKIDVIQNTNQLILFMNNTITEINNLLKIKADAITLILDFFPNFNMDVMLKQTSMEIPSGNVSKKDIIDLQNSIYLSNNLEDKKIIQIQPIQYLLSNHAIKKKYHASPINKSAEYLKMSYSVSYIQKDLYKSLKKLFADLNIKIKSIYTSAHLNAYHSLKMNNYLENLVLLDLNENYSRVNIYLRNALVKSIGIEMTFSDLIHTIAIKENMTYTQAKNLLILNTDLQNYENGDDENLNIIASKCEDFNIRYENIIKSFIKELIQKIQNYLNKVGQNLNNSSFYVTGFSTTLRNFTEYLHSRFNSQEIEQIPNYDYLTKQIDLKESLGLVKYIDVNSTTNNIADTILEIDKLNQFINVNNLSNISLMPEKSKGAN